MSSVNALILFESKYHALNVMSCLAEHEIKCHVFGVGSLWEVKMSKYCHGYVAIDKGELWKCRPSIIERLNQYCSTHRISCLIPGDFASTHFLSKVRGSIDPSVRSIPVAQTGTLQMLNDKWKFSQWLKSFDLPQPETRLATNAEDLCSMRVSFPCAVKPLSGGGRWIGNRVPGSYVKNNREEFLECANVGFPLLVQEFVPGIDVGVNIYAKAGEIIACTMQEFVGEDRLRFFRSMNLLALVERIVALSGFEGLANIDLCLDHRDGKYKIIEFNPRLWGSLRASRWAGVNFPVLAFESALGHDVANLIRYREIEYLFPSKILGRLKKGDLRVLGEIPDFTRRDLGILLGDPIPFVYSIFRR